jgi:hypothetical protein
MAADISTPHGVRAARRGASRWPTLLAIDPTQLLATTIDLPAQASGDPDGVARLNLRSWTSFSPDEAFFRVDRIPGHSGGACRIHVSLVPRSAVREELDRAEESGIPLDGLQLPDGRSIALTGRRQRLRRGLRLLDVVLAIVACALVAFAVRHERAGAERAWTEALERSRSALADAREADALSRDVSDLSRDYKAAVGAMANRNAVLDAVRSIGALVPERARVDALVVGPDGFELRMTIDAGEVPGTPGLAIAGDVAFSTIAELTDGRRSLRATGRLFGFRP